jgi:recombination protein RecR
MASPEIDALARALSRLPGLGPRSARRAVLHLIKRRETALFPLLEALQAVAANLVVCSTCGNVDTCDPCAICRDPRRDPQLLCVVADVADLWALDGRHLFSGRYHVLGGRLSALDGIGPEDLAIAALVARAGDGVVKEVVLALSATMEGQATMHYVAEALASTGVKVSQLAQGLPMGGELDYLDEGTLALALNARRPVG